MIGYRLRVINVFSVMIYVYIYIHREYCIEKIAWCWGLMVYSHFRKGTSFHFIHHKYNALWIIIILQLVLRIFHSPFPMLWIHRHMDCCKNIISTTTQPPNPSLAYAPAHPIPAGHKFSRHVMLHRPAGYELSHPFSPSRRVQVWAQVVSTWQRERKSMF